MCVNSNRIRNVYSKQFIVYAYVGEYSDIGIIMSCFWPMGSSTFPDFDALLDMFVSH